MLCVPWLLIDSFYCFRLFRLTFRHFINASEGARMQREIIPCIIFGPVPNSYMQFVEGRNRNDRWLLCEFYFCNSLIIILMKSEFLMKINGIHFTNSSFRAGPGDLFLQQLNDAFDLRCLILAFVENVQRDPRLIGQVRTANQREN